MTTPRELISELQGRFGKLLVDHSFPLDDRGQFDLEQVRAVCEQRVAIVDWLLARYEPELLFVVFMAADHVHHLGWPEWEERGRDSASPRCTGSSTARSASCSSASATGTCSSSPTTAAARSGASSTSTRGSRRRGSSPMRLAPHLGAERRHRLFELRRRLPQGLRDAAKQRLPGVRERASPATGARDRRLGADARLLLRRLREHRRQPPRPRAGRDRRAGRRVRAGARRDRGAAPRASRPRRASRSSRPCTGARSSTRGRELAKIPDLIVEFRDYAWLGKGNLTGRTPTIWDTIAPRAHPGATYAGSHRPDGIFVLAGPGRPRPASSSRPGSPTSRRPRSTCSASRSPATSRAGCSPRRSIPRCSTGARRSTRSRPRLEVGAPRPYDAEGAAEVEERLRSLGYLE